MSKVYRAANVHDCSLIFLCMEVNRKLTAPKKFIGHGAGDTGGRLLYLKEDSRGHSILMIGDDKVSLSCGV